jgi:FkbM family methyltransferase
MAARSSSNASSGPQTIVGDLIYDVGMHDGTDTDFYLKKGFRVVAIEADPALVAQARDRFSDAIAADRLVIVNAAVSDRDGVTSFYRCPEQDGRCGAYSSTGLSTTVEEVAKEVSRRVGVHFESIDVESCRLETILEEHGVPYYLKVDIEGADVLCLQALEQFSERPKYVSVEIQHLHPDRQFEGLCHLYLLNYRQFKIIDQRFFHKVRLPFPAREGIYVAYKFKGHTTGPFGEETSGRWSSFDEIVSVYRAPTRRTEAWLWGTRDAWFDLHAKLDDKTTPPLGPRGSAGLYSSSYVRPVIRRLSWLRRQMFRSG